MCCIRSKRLPILIAITSLSALIIGIVTKWLAVPLVINDQVYKQLELIEGTLGNDVFVEPPNEIYIKYYFYHVLNPDQIKNGSKPQIKQIGPYVYKELRKKRSIIPIGLDELQYGQWISYTYDQKQTIKEGCVSPDEDLPCTERDKVRVINAALVGVLEIFKDFPDFVKNLINLALDSFILSDTALFKDDLFHNFAVDDLLWHGFDPGIIKFADFVIQLIESYIDTNLHLEINLYDYLPPQLQNGTLAFFRGKNATDFNSFYKINRGRKDQRNYCMIESLNGKNELPEKWWPNTPISPTAERSGLAGNMELMCGCGV